MKTLTLPSFMQDKVTLGIILATVVMLVGSIYFVTRGPAQPTAVSKEQAQELLTVKSDDWVKGPAEAPITIVEYLDFECGACRSYSPMTKQLREEYGDKVRYVVRHFPLSGHINSMTSSLAVEAAGRQGKFWEMHDMVYENQATWAVKRKADQAMFEEYAQKIGLDMEKYKKDVNSSELKERINRDYASGMALNIPGTPSFFINGERIPNPKGYEDFKSLIDGLMPK